MPSAYYDQMKSQLMAQSASDRANTRSAIQKALISFGIVPEGFKDEFGALDRTTRGLIQANTNTGISAYARMLQGKEDTLRDIPRGLAARGLRRSGAKGYKLRRAQLDWDRNKADALAQLLGTAGGMYGQFASSEYQRQLALLQALSQESFGSGSWTPGPNTRTFTPNASGFYDTRPLWQSQMQSSPGGSSPQIPTGPRFGVS